MSAEFDRAATLVRADAVRAWEALTIAQRSALRRCHASPGHLRLRVDCHARTQAALRSQGVLVPLDSEFGKRHLTDLGAIVRRAGMDSETTSKRSGR